MQIAHHPPPGYIDHPAALVCTGTGPHALRPVYALAERIPKYREGALRLGLVTRGQMVGALGWAVENPPEKTRVLDVPAIRSVAT